MVRDSNYSESIFAIWVTIRGDAARYAREKRKFVAARLRYRFIGAHTWIIFCCDMGGWMGVVSGLLLGVGMKNMPLRYGLGVGGFLPGILPLCASVGLNVMRDVPTADNLSNSDVADYLNTPIDGEGCLVALVALALGGLLAGAFALIGGPGIATRGGLRGRVRGHYG